MKHDIRCKGTLSDEDLAREWIRRGTLMWTCTAYGGEGPLDRSDIEKELGKDRLEFLVFKIKTEERLKEMDRVINILLSPSCRTDVIKNEKSFIHKIGEVIFATVFSILGGVIFIAIAFLLAL